MNRPITEAEIKTLTAMCAEGTLELSQKEILYRNRLYAQAVPLLLAKLAAAEADTARQLLLLKGLVNYRASYMPSISPVISETLAVLDAARKEGKP